MWILVVEALGALMLFLFIVWWTLGPTQRRERDALLAEVEAEAANARAAAETRTDDAPSPVDRTSHRSDASAGTDRN